MLPKLLIMLLCWLMFTLFSCVGDEVDDKEKVSQACEADDDDDPENRYIEQHLQKTVYLSCLQYFPY